MKDKIYCSGGQRISTMSFGINRLSEAHHWYGDLCTHQIWIGKQIVYDGRVHLPWSQPDADVLGDIMKLMKLVRDNPTMTAEDLMRGNYTEGE
jgi:hypothetical protein